MDLSKIFQLSKWPTEAFLKTPLSIWKTRMKWFIWGIVAIGFIVLWLWLIWFWLYNSVQKGIKLFSPVSIDTYELVKQEIGDRIKDRTQIIQKRDCINSPTFELQFINGTPEEKEKWITSCNKYSTFQRDYQMIAYKYENIEKNKAQVRYFEVRDMSVDWKIVQQYYEWKLYFEKIDNIWMIASATRNPLKQSEQTYLDL